MKRMFQNMFHQQALVFHQQLENENRKVMDQAGDLMDGSKSISVSFIDNETQYIISMVSFSLFNIMSFLEICESDSFFHFN